jgi:hypothetical protein
MIDLKELRIGNYILPTSKEFTPEYRSKPDTYGTEFEKYNPDQYDYVKLNPELLIKFGWKEILKEFYRPESEITFYIIKEDGKFILGNGENHTLGTYFQYVHELQNLFYSLYKIELIEVVAYNYYLTKNKEYAPTSLGMNLDTFLKMKGDFKLGDYTIGDLPKDIWL